MTREEAIEFGNMWLQINEDCKGSNTYAFFQVAIKALEQEPCDDKTGCWEWVQYDGNPNIGNWHCSECRSIVIKGVKKEKRSVIFPLYKNCPKCSAKMEVEK